MKINRLLQHLLTWGLILAITISVVLSILMWVNPAHYESDIQKSSNSTANKNSLNVKPISSIYSPTQLVQNLNGKQNFLVNPSVNMITEIRNNLVKYKNLKLTDEGKLDANQSLKLLQTDNSLVMSYNNSVTLPIVNKLFNSSFKSSNSRMINRIIIPLNRTGVMYFFSDDDYHYYKLTFRNDQNQSIQKIVEDQRIARHEIKFISLNHHFVTSVQDNIWMPQYSYLINTQAQSYYVLRLLGDSQNVNVKRRKNVTTYNDQSSRQVAFYNDGDINYINDTPNITATDLTQLFEQNYKQLTNSGAILDTIHFFDFNTKMQQFDYRMYVEGFPVFSDNDSGLFRISLNDNGALRMKFSLNSLQIPTPNNDQKYELPSTETVLKTLYARGYKKSAIQNVVLGYHWESDTSSQLVVNLIPSWHVKINNRWYNYNTLVNS